MCYMTDVEIKDTQQVIPLCNTLCLFLLMQIIESAKTSFMPFSKADNIKITESTSGLALCGTLYV